MKRCYEKMLRDDALTCHRSRGWWLRLSFEFPFQSAWSIQSKQCTVFQCSRRAIPLPSQQTPGSRSASSKEALVPTWVLLRGLKPHTLLDLLSSCTATWHILDGEVFFLQLVLIYSDFRQATPVNVTSWTAQPCERLVAAVHLTAVATWRLVSAGSAEVSDMDSAAGAQ